MSQWNERVIKHLLLAKRRRPKQAEKERKIEWYVFANGRWFAFARVTYFNFNLIKMAVVRLEKRPQTKWSLFIFSFVRSFVSALLLPILFILFSVRHWLVFSFLFFLFCVWINFYLFSPLRAIHIRETMTGNVLRFMNDILCKNKTKLFALSPIEVLSTECELWIWIIAIIILRIWLNCIFTRLEFCAVSYVAIKINSIIADSIFRSMCVRATGFPSVSPPSQISFSRNGSDSEPENIVHVDLVRLPDIRTIWSDSHVWSMWTSFAHKMLVRILCTCFVHSMTSMTTLK